MEENQEISKPKASVFKKLSKIFIILILVILALISSLLSLLFIYEDEVKAAIVLELNKHLKAEVKIDPKNIELTIIKSFPDCSIEFKKVLILEALTIKNRDTLLYANNLNLHFNIDDLWNKKYDINKIKIKDAVAKLKVLKNGRTNYMFWEEADSTKGKSADSVSFNLKLISIENCRFSYRDRQLLFKTELELKKVEFKGSFNLDDFELESKGKVYIHQIAHLKSSFLKGKNSDYLIKLSYSNNTYRFEKADFSVNQLAMKLSGDFVYKDSLENLNLNFKAPQLDIASLLSLLPENYKSKVNDYESSGNFYASGNVHYKNATNFKIESDFGIKQGQITYKALNTKATEINVEGKLKLSQANSELQLSNIFAKLNNDEIKATCLIQNFKEPFIQLNASAEADLENIQNFWPIDTLSLLKGKISLHTEMDGLLSDLKDQTFSTKVKLNLSVRVSSLQAQFKGDEKMYAIENCSLTAKEREIEVHDLKLKRGSSDLNLNGKIPGVFNYLMDRNSPLIISGNLNSNYIKLEDFYTSNAQTRVNDKALIPENVQFKLNASVAKFSFGKFEATELSAEMEIHKQKAIISDVKLQTMDGEAEINLFADNSKNKLEVVLQSNLKNINVNALFYQLNNFGQSTLQDKNIKGFINAGIDFSGIWNNRLEANLNTMASSCTLNIERGELVDFKPLLSLSKFVDVQELERIKFSSLQSTVEIKNSLISIPKTSIKNSAINIDFSGTHSFNNDIDYHIQLLISDLLSRKRKNKNDEFAQMEKDPENRRSVFIKMTGNIDNPIIKYDRKGLKEKVRNDLKQEKQNLKQLLRDEFGLFKKDSLPKRTVKSEPGFELENPGNNAPKKSLEPKKREVEEDF